MTSTTEQVTSFSPKIFSFFSGSGLLDLGFETENYRTVYVNESYKPFLDAYRFSRKQIGVAPPEYGYYDGSITEFDNPQLNRRLKELLGMHDGAGQFQVSSAALRVPISPWAERIAVDMVTAENYRRLTLN